jgi:DNA-binding CsgD family transcriptional regulator
VKRVHANLHHLTAREQDVVQRLAASHNTDGIARALGVTPKTAENYIGHVYDKLGLNEMGREAPHLRKVMILAKACMLRDLGTSDWT